MPETAGPTPRTRLKGQISQGLPGSNFDFIDFWPWGKPCLESELKGKRHSRKDLLDHINN